MIDQGGGGLELLDDPTWLAEWWEASQDHEADPADPAWRAFEDQTLQRALDEEDALAELARTARTVASFQGFQLRRIVAVVDAAVTAATADPCPRWSAEEIAQSAEHSACAEIGLALGLSAPAASGWVDLALALGRCRPACGGLGVAGRNCRTCA